MTCRVNQRCVPSASVDSIRFDQLYSLTHSSTALASLCRSEPDLRAVTVSLMFNMSRRPQVDSDALDRRPTLARRISA